MSMPFNYGRNVAGGSLFPPSYSPPLPQTHQDPCTIYSKFCASHTTASFPHRMYVLEMTLPPLPDGFGN
jgi:hypothetical protein